MKMRAFSQVGCLLIGALCALVGSGEMAATWFAAAIIIGALGEREA